MKRIVGLTLHLLLLSFSLRAQHQDLSEKPNIWLQNTEQKSDTGTLLNAFKSGTLNGHFRYYFSATDNQPGLSDYYANAAGGGLRFETARFRGFKIGISGFYTFNIGSSNLAVPDARTGQMNRYELGLFDVDDPWNKKNIDRLEELYLKYHWRKSSVAFGKILINTPLINLQDGRMRPTGVEGLWVEFNESETFRFSGGYLISISPRSTTRWYNGGQSIGVYSMGVNANGIKSNYRGNVQSNGVGVLGVQIKPVKFLKIQLWDFYIDNVLNTGFFQMDYEKETANKNVFVAAVQAIRQDAIHDGGNPDPAKRYVDKHSKAFTFGAKMALQNKRYETSLNYNRISNIGRYLFPREWGRDPFFTFMPRERNEGLGNANAVTLKYQRNFLKYRIKASFVAGYFSLPDVYDFKNNKYGMPCFAQYNLDVRYVFSGALSGLEAQALVVAKYNQSKVYGNEKLIINKVNMNLYNLILNYRF